MPRNRWGITSWLFMRLSALALIFLTLGHFGIQHIVNDVHDLTTDFVLQRWSMVGWRIYDVLLLTLAMVHGLNGLRIVVDDYVVKRQWNQAVRWAILIVGIVVTVIGAAALVAMAFRS